MHCIHLSVPCRASSSLCRRPSACLAASESLNYLKCKANVSCKTIYIHFELRFCFVFYCVTADSAEVCRSVSLSQCDCGRVCLCVCVWRTSLLSYTATWLVLNVCWALLRAVNRNRYSYRNCCCEEQTTTKTTTTTTTGRATTTTTTIFQLATGTK